MKKKVSIESTESMTRLSKSNADASIPKFYVVNNERYINPHYINKNVNTQIIDTWPAHSSGILHPTREILVTNAHHIKVLDEHESRLPNLVPKPKLLEFIQTHIKNQLAKYKLTEIKPNELRLQIYSDAFSCLIDSLESYKPLLASVKQEYEMNIRYLQRNLRRVEPIKEVLWTLSDEYDCKFIRMRKLEVNDTKEMKTEINKIKHEIFELKVEKESLKMELLKLKKNLKKLSYLYRKESDSRKLLLTDMDNVRSKLKELERIANKPVGDEYKEDPLKLQWGIDQAKEALKIANKRIMELEDGYSKVVKKKRYEECFQEIIQNGEQLDLVKFDNEQLKIDKEKLQEKYEKLFKQRDYMYYKWQRQIVKGPARMLDRSISEKIENEKDLLKEEINNWTQIASKITHEELVKKIQLELQKTDGSAELMLEVLMNVEEFNTKM